MVKKALSAFLAVVMIFSILPLSVFAEASEDVYFDYEVNNGEATITGIAGYYDGNKLIIPETIDGYPVTTIGHHSFIDCTDLNAVVIPQTVTTIESWAFNCCENLTNITLPNSITSIGSHAFQNTGYYNDSSNWENGVLYLGKYLIAANSEELPTEYVIKEGTTVIAGLAFNYCENLRKIVLPKELISIGSDAFHYCIALEEIELPEGLKTIGASAFVNCYSLTDITLPNTLKVIPYAAFAMCTSLKNATISNGIEEIAATAFLGCYDLRFSVADDSQYFCTDELGVLYNKDKTTLIKFPGYTELTEYTIPDEVTAIEAYAFADAKTVKEITVPAAVTYMAVQDGTVYGDLDMCMGLIVRNYFIQYDSDWEGDVFSTIPDFKIYGYTGSEAKTYANLCDIKFVDLNDGVEGCLWYKIRNEQAIVTNCDWSATGEIVIPDTLGGYPVTAIADAAFSCCKNITSVKIPSTVNSIGEGAFKNCSALTAVNIPSGVTSINDELFYGCSSLKSLDIPDGASLGYDVFYGCTSLTDVKLPADLTEIPSNTFRDCSSLKSIDIPDGASLGDNAFYGCTSLTDVKLPTDLTEIPYGAFQNCKALKSINLPESVQIINDGAFYGCLSLESFHIDDNVTQIGTYYEYSDTPAYFYSEVFLQCPKIKFTVSENNQYFCTDEYGVLYSKDKTRLIKYPENSLEKSYTIPNSVTQIDWNAFYGAKNLRSVTVPYSLMITDEETYINYINSSGIGRIYYFDENYNLSDTSNHAEIKYYSAHENESFQNGTENKYINLNDHSDGYIYYKIVDEKAVIYACSVLATGELTIPDTLGGYSVTEIVDFAFSGCDALTKIKIPSTVKTIGEYAFRYCSSLTEVELPEGLTEIPDGAFLECFSLKNVAIPQSVVKIGESVFFACVSLESLIIPENVEQISVLSFIITPSLTITVNENNKYFSTDANGFLFDKEKTTLILAPNTNLTEYTVPKTTTTIYPYAFINAANVKTLTIPSKVKNIYEPAFGNAIEITYNEETGQYEEALIATGFTIKGVKGSAAENYAIENNIAFVEITETECTHEETELRNASTGNCTASGYSGDLYCLACGELISKGNEIPSEGHSWEEITINSTCKVQGVKYEICLECEEVQSYEVLPLAEHTYGEWTVTKQPTYQQDGEKQRVCSVCGDVETEAIPALLPKLVAEDPDSGVAVFYNENSFTNPPEIIVSENYDGESFNLLNKEKGQFKSILLDITITVDGEKVQPSGTVVVRMPVPDGYNPEKIAVYFVPNDNSNLEIMKSWCDDGYLYFEASHFSAYAVVDESQIACDHLCHKDGFVGFFWKIIRLFWKLFKMNPVCECGAAHY